MRRAKPLSEVWIHFERQKIDNKYMAKKKKKKFFLSWWFFSGKKNVFFSTGKKTFTSLGRTKQRGKNPCRLAAAGRITASAPAATGRQENRQAEAEASPEGEGCKPKKLPADRRQSRPGGPGSRPTARGAQWREPRTSHDPQLQ